MPAIETDAVQSHPDVDRFLRLPEVISLVGLSRSTIYAEVSKGRFPAALQLSTSTVAWRASEVVAWMQSRQRAGALAAGRGAVGRAARHQP